MDKNTNKTYFVSDVFSLVTDVFLASNDTSVNKIKCIKEPKSSKRGVH